MEFSAVVRGSQTAEVAAQVYKPEKSNLVAAGREGLCSGNDMHANEPQEPQCINIWNN